jgi:translation initiation factor 6 (eIF-6)
MCDITEDILETLLRLKDSTTTTTDINNNNRMASIIAKPHDKRTNEEKEILAIHVIKNGIASLNNNNRTASVTNKGEVVELQSLLKLYNR